MANEDGSSVWLKGDMANEDVSSIWLKGFLAISEDEFFEKCQKWPVRRREHVCDTLMCTRAKDNTCKTFSFLCLSCAGEIMSNTVF